MKIGEIPVNTTVQIRVCQNEMRFECTAIVVATRDDGLFLTPIKHNGQLVDFSSDKIQILAFFVNEKKQVLGWSGCRIRRDRYQSKLCHVLTTKRPSVRVNRRSEPRVQTEMNATLRSVSDDKEREIIVRNYCENGIGFLCHQSVPERDWTACSLIFEDAQQSMHVIMRVHILRQTEHQGGIYKFGARILSPDPAWTQYVQNKMEELRERSKNPGKPGVNT
ncbi:hypothetical protein AALB53_03370 [Lachnospiraceae bacterium 47-T17]